MTARTSSPASPALRACVGLEAWAGGKSTGKWWWLAAFHECRQPLLSRASLGAMLDSYAREAVYLNPGGVLGGGVGRDHCLQVGGRERGHPLQRSAARERREGRGSRADHVCSESRPDRGGAGDGIAASSAGCLLELLAVAAHSGTGVPQRLLRHCRREHLPGTAPRRSRPRDARRAGPDGPGRPITINPVDRGTHSVVATIQDPSGQAVCSTPPATFYVRQASLLAPQHQKP